VPAPHGGVTIRRAGPGDLAVLLPLIAGFYAVDHHEYDEQTVTDALGPLLADDTYGLVLLAVAADPVGYAVLTWGYGLESGGREAVLDELYVRDRGYGIGALLLTTTLDAARDAGVRHIYLETESHNARARAFYARHGLTEDDSIWMSRSLLDRQ